MTPAEIQSEWLDLVDDVENGLIMYHEEKLAGTNVTVGRSRITSGKFRKKPVVIEAVQWLNKKIVCPPGPQWFADEEERGIIQLAGNTLYIKTLEGEMRADVGDWIIRGVKGEIYSCKPDIFEATYEPV